MGQLVIYHFKVSTEAYKNKETVKIYGFPQAVLRGTLVGGLL